MLNVILNRDPNPNPMPMPMPMTIPTSDIKKNPMPMLVSKVFKLRTPDFEFILFFFDKAFVVPFVPLTDLPTFPNYYFLEIALGSLINFL